MTTSQSGLARRMVLACAAALAAGAVMLAGAAPAEAQVRIRFNSWLGPMHPIMALTVRPWAEEVERVTEGRVRVEFTAGPMGPPPAQFDMVRDGVVDAAISIHGYTPTRFELTRVGELPFLALGAEPLSVALWRVHEEFFAGRQEHRGVRLLGLFTSQPGIVYAKATALDGLPAWSGLKIAGGSRINVDIAERLGAVPVQAPGPQIYEMLERGIVDAGFLDQSSFKDFNLGRQVRHALTFPRGIYAVTWFLAVNEATWNRISAADRAAIERISGEAFARRAGANWDAEAAVARRQMEEQGISIVRADGAYLQEIQTRLAPLEAAWLEKARAAGVDGAAVLARLREVVAAN
jgi:TRAP-type C4-dicarboxylate transport system substrate-binding protein